VVARVRALPRSTDDEWFDGVVAVACTLDVHAACIIIGKHQTNPTKPSTTTTTTKGLARAAGAGFLDASPINGRAGWRFDLGEYEHYEAVEHGDLTWVVPGKLLAFSGPAARRDAYVGFVAMVPEDYAPYFAARGVTTVVRLNKKVFVMCCCVSVAGGKGAAKCARACAAAAPPNPRRKQKKQKKHKKVYERERFLASGLRHVELYFPDGSCPSEALLMRFLQLAEQEPGALAVHCKAGLGRTGVLISAYIMKHYR
jgi:cell division cycle 14